MTFLGESIAASTAEILVQTMELGTTPPLGSVVSVDGILAVVFASESAPVDSSRRTVALGLDGSDVAAEHPELHSLLRTTFRARPVADEAGLPPPIPAKLHLPAHLANEKQLDRLREDFSHLALLSDLPATLIAAHVLLLAAGDHARAVAAGRVLAAELATDAEKLRLALSGIERGLKVKS